MPDRAPSSDPLRAQRLDGAASAYLRGAAEQPIDWYPWGPEPFEVARRTDRPILLDIGAVWCHWCHVMDEGTYADAEVARLLGQHFVAVKVDRDERPEVDRRYQRQVSALAGQGGWPLTAFLTPSGEAFLGGTYFPPEDGLGRPGFRRVLREVARIWREERDKALGNVRAAAEALARQSEAPRAGARAPDAAFLASVLEQVHASYDPINGGFGFAPKFPHPTAVSYLLYAGYAQGDARAPARAVETLLRMADGGIYDHVGGGFHRYATDEAWHIPHFEKMASDNASLLSAYVEGARRSPEPRLLETIEGTLAWAEAALGDPRGGWGASQDADNAPGDDGSYFTWSRAELKEALTPEELKLVVRHFGVGSEGRMPHDPDRNVLFRLMPVGEAASGVVAPEAAPALLASALVKLREARARRPTPFVDRALYADLNGDFVRGVATAGTLLERPALVALARASANRFLAHAYDDELGVAHCLGPDGASGRGHLEDQAMFALGLVELAAATADPAYSTPAERLLDLVFAEYRGADGRLADLASRLYDGPKVASLAAPTFPAEDNPHLAPPAAIAIALLRLHALTGAPGPRDRARELLASCVPAVEGAGLFASGTALAVGLAGTPAARVVVEGSGPEAAALLKAARRTYHPNLVVFAGVPPEPFSLPEELGAGRARASPRALVCFGDRCLAPVTEPSRLASLLAAGGRDAS